MLNREIYLDPPLEQKLENQGVANVNDDTRDAGALKVLRYELRTFVCDGQYEKGMQDNDIFVRWKSLEEQPIGWNPDLNDGVRLNIRPWMTVGDIGKKGAGLLRDKPNIHWKKDRGKDVESAPWYDLGPQYGGKDGDRINDHHLTLAEKKAARNGAE